MTLLGVRAFLSIQVPSTFASKVMGSIVRVKFLTIRTIQSSELLQNMKFYRNTVMF